MDDGSRIPAARWVIGLGRLYWGLLVLAAVWSLFGVLFTWSPAALVVPLLLAGWAAAWGALLRAFSAHRRGAWRILLGLTFADALRPLPRWLLVGPPTASTLLSAGVATALFGLLLHGDSRDWVGEEPVPRPSVDHPGGWA